MSDRYEDLDEYNWLAAEVDRHEEPQAIALGALLIETLHPSSVIDVGCSSGIYLVPYMNQGIEVLGIDGASGVGKWIPGKFKVVDLRNPWSPPKRFDLALNIETAEHLRPEYADVLIDTLAACSDIIYFSAAREGQGGEGHYNCQNKPYWTDKFAARGYGINPKNSEIQAIIDTDPVYDHCHWLRWNGVLLSKNG